MARAAPPAPSTSTRARGGVDPLVAHRAEEALAVGRRAEEAAAVARDDGVDGAERARRRASARRTRAAASCLCGMVTLRPAEARARARPSSAAAAPRPLGTANAQNTQSSPAAANAALWMAGERECADRVADDAGDPGARRRGVLIRRAPRSCGCSASCPASVSAKRVDTVVAGHVEEVR